MFKIVSVYLSLFFILVFFTACMNYLVPEDDVDEPVIVDNQPPYEISGPSIYNYQWDWGGFDSFFLQTVAPESDLDPDGDNVQFKFDLLPSGISVNSDTGEIIIDNNSLPYDPRTPPTGAGPYSLNFNVWTEDERGLKSNYFEVTINVYSST